MFGCAVQGPISGGPVDKSPPVLLFATPENLSTGISSREKIILNFNELIDPISVYKSITINNQEFKIKVKGKRIILYPEDEWNKNFLIDIYINTYLSDYRSNSLRNPIDLFYSLNDRIPQNSIHGHIVDIENIIDQYNEESSDILFELGLFKNINDEKRLIKKIHSNEDLEFVFNAIEEGVYSIAAVEDRLIDLNVDFLNRRYSVVDNINIFNDDSTMIRLNISNPISKKEISTINFTNQYYVNYTLDDGSIELGVIDTIYNNFNSINFSGELIKTSLMLKNDFESYKTNIFEFIIPDIVDTISPFIDLISKEKTEFLLQFSEPLENSNNIKPFYILKDSNRVYLDFKFKDSKLKNIISIDTDQFEISDTDYSINIHNNLIKDLYGNMLLDSIALVSLSSSMSTNQSIGTSNIFGEILNGNLSIPVVVSLYNIETSERTLILADENHHFSFKLVQPGNYLLQCYENYNFDKESAFPYFSGTWSLGASGLRFSDVLGPIEARANWDIDNINIELK
tara:strand:- start:1141 stop:2682 length:1542 start_codon:yes stop_codon:yes gene_type:complete